MNEFLDRWRLVEIYLSLHLYEGDMSRTTMIHV